MTNRTELLRLVEELRHALGEVSTTPIPQTPRVLYDLDEAAQILRMSLSTLHREHNAGRIAFKKNGRRSHVHRDELESYAANLPSA